MRKIKFRAWDKKNKEFFKPTYEAYKGNLLDINISLRGQVSERTLEMCSSMKRVDDWILQQFTGLLDKNGKEIFEGDIVTRDTQQWVVEWDDEVTGFYPLRFVNVKSENYEVIGNIFENPELIKE